MPISNSRRSLRGLARRDFTPDGPRLPVEFAKALVCTMLIAGAATGCAPRLLVPNAVISRYEIDGGVAHGLRVCQVQLGWTIEELHQTCGPAEFTVADTLHPPGQCSLYRSLTHPFDRGAAGVHWVAVCHYPLVKESGHWVKQAAESPGRAVYLKESLATSRVYATYGLAEGPTPTVGRVERVGQARGE